MGNHMRGYFMKRRKVTLNTCRYHWCKCFVYVRMAAADDNNISRIVTVKIIHYSLRNRVITKQFKTRRF